MKALERNLYSRNNHLYYRSAIPRHLHQMLSIREIIISLKITDRREARVKAAQLNQAERAIIEDFQQQLREAQGAITKEAITSVLRQLDRLRHNQSTEATLSPEGHPESGNSPETAPALFSNIVQRYIADCITDTPRTVEQKQATFLLFQDLQGDKRFREITATDAQAFKSALLQMPAHARKRIKTNSLKGIKISDIEGAESLHYKTINGRLGNLRALFNWAERHGLIQGKNPFSGIAIKGTKASSSKRSSFKSEEIKALFGSPLYTGCKGEKWAQRFESGDHVIKDALYWIPFIGLYSGMRLNEICQMEVADIRNEEGVWVFDVNDAGGKRLKTSSSCRYIPIHDQLIQDGLLEYWQGLKDQSAKRLFPDLKEGVNDSLSAPFSKRFRRLLNTLGLTRDGICFHSLRHTFIDGLRKAGVERSIAMTLTGHQSSDVHDQYGNGYDLYILHAALNRLTFTRP